MSKKSIFRGPDVKHFTLLHRSQRDPLINDQEGGERILKQVNRLNDINSNNNQKKAKTKDDLEGELGLRNDRNQSKAEDPSNYNIFFDDLDEYDYLQHLRPLGQNKDSIFVEKPLNKNQLNRKKKIELRQNSQKEGQGKGGPGLELPEIVKPTPNDQTLNYKDHLEYALQSNSALEDNSLFPISDDPSLREVLVALDDEAYIEDEANDEFFERIIEDGERDESEQPDWSIEDQQQASSFSYFEPISQWESDVGKFKNGLQKKRASHDDDESVEVRSELDTDRTRGLSKSSGNRGSINGSSFSMSSSSMFRNEGLTTLDERFEKIQQEYDSSSSSDDDGDDDEYSDEGSEASNLTERPTTRTDEVREDFDEILDEFLKNFEVLGGKFKPILTGKTPQEKLATLRSELLGSSSNSVDGSNSSICGGEDEDEEELERKVMKQKILKYLKDQEEIEIRREERSKINDKSLEISNLYDDDRIELENRWDCQSILSTYSNLENHPKLIRIREAVGEKKNKKNKTKHTNDDDNREINKSKIEIDRLTGFPIVNGKLIRANNEKINESQEGDDDDDETVDGESVVEVRKTIKRDRNEDKVEKRNRKNEVKIERSLKRQEKKNLKKSFRDEKIRQGIKNQSIASKNLGINVRQIVLE